MSGGTSPDKQSAARERAEELREQADHIDVVCHELIELDQVPPDVLEPIQTYAVRLREQAREAGSDA